MTDAPDAADGVVPSPDDQHLLDALGRALPAEPLPPGLLGRAAQLLTYLDLDRELAELLTQPAEAAGMRGGAAAGPGSTAVLAFRTADGSVAVDVTAEGSTLTAQVLAGAPVEVALETRSGAVGVAVPDELGRCTFRDVPPGPTRLTLRAAAPAKEVVTDWFLT